MQSNEYEAIKITDENQQKINDAVVIEAPLQININGDPYTVIMRTPGDDIDLIRGLLFAEDIYKGEKELDISIINEDKNFFSTIDVKIDSEKLGKGYLNKRTLLSVSSCGICGKQSIDDIKVKGDALNDSTTIDSNKIESMFLQMQEEQKLFKKTGASHAAAIFDSHYKLMKLREDIGRHNAVDKVLGCAKNSNLKTKIDFLLVSGRVSYEIVTKAFFHKIPTIIAVSGCSSLAIDFCKEFGIKLIGFSRSKKHTFYS